MSICAKSHGPLYLQDHEVSYKTRTELARDCHDKNEKLQNMKLQCAQSVFIHCFRVFAYPGETLALVVYMASQMNRGVTIFNNKFE